MFAIAAHSQTVTHITTLNGLSTNNLTEIIKDHNNYMWIGSYSGLHKHEGARIKLYNKVGKDSASLSANEMHTLFEDRQGFIWAGTVAGLDKINPVNGFITHYPLHSEDVKSPSIGYIISITQDKYDSIWASTSVGFFKIDYKTGNYRRIKTSKDGSGIPECNTGYKADITTDKGIWFQTGHGMLFYDYQQHEFHHQYYNPDHEAIFNLNGPGDIIHGSDMCADKSGNLYFVCRDTMLLQFNYNTNKIDSFHIPFPPGAWRCCYSVVLDAHNNIWIGFRHGGLLIFDTKAHQFNAIRNTGKNDLLSSNYIYSICEDYLGNMWAATNNGLDIINYYNKSIQKYELSNLPDYKDLRFESGMLSASQSNIFIPFYKDRVFTFNTSNDSIDYLKADKATDLHVSYIIRDKDGHDIAAHKSQLCVLTSLQHKSSCNLYPSIMNKVLLAHHQNISWHTVAWNNEVFKTFDGRFYIVNNNTITDTLYGDGFMKESCLSFNHQKFIYLTGNYDVVMYDFNSKKGDIIPIPELAKNAGFEFSIPRDVLEDQHSNIWITSQNGLVRYSLSTKQLSTYTTNDNLSHNFTYALALDKMGNLWIESLGGIDLYNQASHTITNVFNFPTGNYMDAFGSSIYGTDSFIYFLAGNKFIKINPALYYQTSIKIASLNINDILVNGLHFFIDSSNTKPLFSYENNRFEFKFGLLDFTKQSKLQYFYYLEGLEKTWVNAGNKAEVVYNYVPPGHYVFHVKAVDADGYEMKQQLSFAFIITPPFWKTTWFYVLLLLLAGSVIYYFVKRRENHLQKIQAEKLRISALESEQLRNQLEIQTVNEKLSEARLEALRSQMNPHFIFNSLNAIQECILAGNIDNAYSYLSQFSKLQRTVLNNSEKEFITLRSELDVLKLYLSLESLRFNQSFSYSFDIDAEVDIDEVQVPTMLIQPYVENAIWHGFQNKKDDKVLIIRCKDEHGYLDIIIDDNGIGREKAHEIKLQKIATLHTDSKGMSLSKRRMELLSEKYKATISLEVIDKKNEQNEATGTTIHIKIPMNN